MVLQSTRLLLLPVLQSTAPADLLPYDYLVTMEDEWIQEHVEFSDELATEAWERFAEDRGIYDCSEDSRWYDC